MTRGTSGRELTQSVGDTNETLHRCRCFACRRAVHRHGVGTIANRSGAGWLFSARLFSAGLFPSGAGLVSACDGAASAIHTAAAAVLHSTAGIFCAGHWDGEPLPITHPVVRRRHGEDARSYNNRCGDRCWARLGAMMRHARHVSLLLLISFGALSGRAFGLNWGNGLSEMGASISDTANALMQEELQRQQMEQQHQRQMQEIQAQHDLQMQQLQDQQRLFLEQQQRLEADRQRAEQEQQKQRMAAATKSKAIDPAQMAHLVKTYPDWRTIVGAVDISKEPPNPNNPFRKWLSTRGAAYQARINGSDSPREIEKAIALFRADSGPPQ
jgi:hypothetical protein